MNTYPTDVGTRVFVIHLWIMEIATFARSLECKLETVFWRMIEGFSFGLSGGRKKIEKEDFWEDQQIVILYLPNIMYRKDIHSLLKVSRI